MAVEKTPRKLFCKRAMIEPHGGATLQARLAAALTNKALVKERVEPVTPTEFRIIAQHYNVQAGIAGIFTAFERGASAVSVLEDPTAEALTLDQIKPPPDADGKARQWVEGLFYFYVHGDIVVLIQSTAVRARQFEAHLSWLLCPGGDAVGPAVVLVDQYGRSALEQLKKLHVKDVKIGGPLLQANQEPGANNEPAKVEAHINVHGKMLDALKAVLEQDQGPGFKWEDALHGNIEAWLHVSYRRTTSKSAQSVLDEIALTLRNVDELDTVITLNDGQTITGNDLRLSKDCRIESKERVLLADKAFEAMVRWLKELVETKQLPV